MNVKPALCLAASIAAALLVEAAPAQAQGGLLFTPRRTESSVSQCWPSPGTALNQVTAEEVQYVVHQASTAFATHNGYGQLLGDFDADGDYWEPRLFGSIDALMRPRTAAGQQTALNIHSLFLSPSDDVVVGGQVIAGAGDVFRVLPGGAIEHFLSMTQVQTAFGINEALDVDAVALAFDPQLGGVFLSLELGRTAYLGSVDDGDILRIPSSAITWGSGTDGCVVVQSVQANSGQVFATEAAVDAMCANSGVGACTGFPVTLVGDVDGLTWNDQTAELWFCGEFTTGCSVLTTAGGGQIAVLNGRALGGLAPSRSSNLNVGLFHVCGSTLNALALAPGDLQNFATDTRTPAQPRSATIEAGGAAGPVWFLLNVLPDVPGPFAADPATVWPNACFPLLYPFLTHVTPTSSVGCATFTANVPGTFAGFHVTIQAVSLGTSGAVLSPPAVIDL